MEGQEEQLQKFSNLLHEKEQKTFDVLKTKHILRDKTQDPLVRVTLRQMKDFAVPVMINNGDGTELFWKWYLDTNKDVEHLIRKELGIETKPETVQQELPVEKPVKKETIKPTAKTAYLQTVLDYLEKNTIHVHSHEVVRKNEIDLIIDLPTAVGVVKYYCKAKSKKRNNEADLSSAFTQGQLRKLPVLYLTDGDLTKRAKEMLESQLSSITVKRM